MTPLQGFWMCLREFRERDGGGGGGKVSVICSGEKGKKRQQEQGRRGGAERWRGNKWTKVAYKKQWGKKAERRRTSTLMWQTDAPEMRRKRMEWLLSTPSWTLSARLEPERLVGSPSDVVFHPGHVTPNPPWACLSLARPSVLLQPGTMNPNCPEHTLTDRIREEKKTEWGRKQENTQKALQSGNHVRHM